MPKQRYAFRCNTCQHLETAGQAGEREVPAACANCGAGVHFVPGTGAKTYDEDNWTVLADLPKAELRAILKFHGIDETQIARHKPQPAADVPRETHAIERSATETVGAEDLP